MCNKDKKISIVFICGSFEPGRDGIGDYVRNLGCALARTGHKIGIVAFHDFHCQTSRTELQSLQANHIQVLRLPASLAERKRVSLVEDWMAYQNYDWVSLQYVPYAFNTKGLPLQLTASLKKIIKGKYCHLMVHETWVGVEKITQFKNVVIGMIQRRLLHKMLTVLQPRVIHTHLPHYMRILERFGCYARPLPLFSNFQTLEGIAPHKNVDKTFTVGCFSRVAPIDPMLRFLKGLSAHLAQSGIQLVVLLFGGAEPEMSTFAGLLLQHLGPAVTVSNLGFLDQGAVSKVIASCDLGLTPVPLHGLGKSGSVAVFLAQGIPVAAPNIMSGKKSRRVGFFSEWQCRSIVKVPELKAVEEARGFARKCREDIDITQIAERLVLDLLGSNYGS